MQNDLRINWQFLLVNWRRVLFAFAIGTILAGGAYKMAPLRWEASTLLQMGQVPANEMGDSMPKIETANAIIAKIMRPAFIKNVIKHIGHENDLLSLLPRQYDGKGYMRVRIMSPGIMTISLQAAAPDLAKQMMEGIVDQIIEDDNKMVDVRTRDTKETSETDPKKQTARSISCNGQLTIRADRMIGEVEVLSKPVFPDPAMYMALGIILAGITAVGLLWHAAKSQN